VAPAKVLLPPSVSVPAPALVNANVPAVFWMTPENVELEPLLPIVNVGVLPATVSTVPLPDRPLRTALLAFKSSVPPTVTSPLPAPEGMALATPRRRVPLLTTVLPL